MAELPEALLTLNPYEARTAAAIFERLFPAEQWPRRDCDRRRDYLDRALAGAYHGHIETYRLALAAFDRIARSATIRPLPTATPRNRMPC